MDRGVIAETSIKMIQIYTRTPEKEKYCMSLLRLQNQSILERGMAWKKQIQVHQSLISQKMSSVCDRQQI